MRTGKKKISYIYCLTNCSKKNEIKWKKQIYICQGKYMEIHGKITVGESTKFGHLSLWPRLQSVWANPDPKSPSVDVKGHKECMHQKLKLVRVLITWSKCNSFIILKVRIIMSFQGCKLHQCFPSFVWELSPELI